MFKFDFEVNDDENIDQTLNFETEPDEPAGVVQTTPELEPFTELSLDQLLDSLPSVISFSPLSIPLSSGRGSVTLIRRDLFDARFQLMSAEEDTHDNGDAMMTKGSLKDDSDESSLGFLDNPSDLIPGVYEGGLKTWECSLDLVDYLNSLRDQPNFQGFSGRRILELGCGTGVPSLFMFHELLSSHPAPPSNFANAPLTEIHLQDYNTSVLQLVTFPNFLLTWYTSPHSSSYRALANDDPEELAMTRSIDSTTPGELEITPELKTAFISSLKSLDITLRFFSGSWDAFDLNTTMGLNITSRYNVLLTSETIYRLDTLPLLVELMRSTSIPSRMPYSPHPLQEDDYLCLVAAKVLYFGVGGGVPDFENAVRKVGGHLETVLERKVGVGRKVLRVLW